MMHIQQSFSKKKKKDDAWKQSWHRSKATILHFNGVWGLVLLSLLKGPHEEWLWGKVNPSEWMVLVKEDRDSIQY